MVQVEARRTIYITGWYNEMSESLQTLVRCEDYTAEGEMNRFQNRLRDGQMVCLGYLRN